MRTVVFLRSPVAWYFIPTVQKIGNSWYCWNGPWKRYETCIDRSNASLGPGKGNLTAEEWDSILSLRNFDKKVARFVSNPKDYCYNAAFDRMLREPNFALAKKYRSLSMKAYTLVLAAERHLFDSTASATSTVWYDIPLSHHLGHESCEGVPQLSWSHPRNPSRDQSHQNLSTLFPMWPQKVYSSFLVP